MINLNKLGLDNKKILLVILVFFIILYLDFLFLLNSQFQGIKKLEPKIKKIKLDIDALTRDSTKLQQIGTRKKLTSQEKKIIPETQIPALLESISSIANKNNVKIMQITPSRETKIKDEKVSLDTRFIPLLITLDLSCDYHHLGSFINNLENAEEFMTAEEIKIVPDTANYLLQKVNLELKTYVKK